MYKINNSNGNGRERIKESVTEKNKKFQNFELCNRLSFDDNRLHPLKNANRGENNEEATGCRGVTTNCHEDTI